MVAPHLDTRGPFNSPVPSAAALKKIVVVHPSRLFCVLMFIYVAGACVSV